MNTAARTLRIEAGLLFVRRGRREYVATPSTSRPGLYLLVNAAPTGRGSLGFIEWDGETLSSVRGVDTCVAGHCVPENGRHEFECPGEDY